MKSAIDRCPLSEEYAVMRPLAGGEIEKYKETMGPVVSIILAADLDEGKEREIEAVLQSLGSVQKSAYSERSLVGYIETTTPIGGTYTGEGRGFGIDFVSYQAICELTKIVP